ncbi:MAG: cell division protein FtsQ/DivIB, partial [Armatimonadota bacterium]
MNALGERRPQVVVQSSTRPRRRVPRNRVVRDPRWGWFAGGVFVLMAQVLAAASLSPRFLVDPARVEVTGVRGPLAKRILNIAAVPAANVFRLDVATIEHRVEEIPEIAGVEVLRRWPNRVELRVRHRSAATAVRTSSGRWFLADEGLVPFRAVSVPPAGMDRVLFHRIGPEQVVRGLSIALPDEVEALRQCGRWCRR